MADFASDLAMPTTSKVVPKTCQDLGSIQTHAAQAAGTVNGADQVNCSARGLILTIDITAITAGSLTVTIQRKDKASGKYLTVLASAALAAAATTVLRVSPDLTAAANTIAQDYIGETFRVSSTIATGPVTATIGATLIP